MRFEEDLKGDVLVVKVIESRIAADVSENFKKALLQIISRGSRIVILDLSDVTFIDSLGLGGLIAGLKVVKEGGDLILCGARDTVLSMFKLTRLNKIFTMFDTVDAAVASVAAR